MRKGDRLNTGRQIMNPAKIVWFAMILVISILIAWVQFTGENIGLPQDRIFASLGFSFLAFSLLSLAASRFLMDGKLKHPHPYRIAFIAAFIFGLILIILQSIMGAERPVWPELAGITFGAFLGSFIASNQALRWWENNAPPTPQIEQAVMAAHQKIQHARIRPRPIKRLFDILFASTALLLSLPVWLLVILLIWWEDPGPILFVKNAVDRGGRNFKQLKFRSMILDAEEHTGPISGYENDERVLWFGKFLRKTALDEVPQLINILLGHMSAVGPRPQRTVLVHSYLQAVPVYAQRHLVRPGLAGLAQVADAYDISPEEKLAWDLLYIEKASFWLDFKILFSAFYLVFVLRWLHEAHPEHRIRKLLDIEKSEAIDYLDSVQRQSPT